MARAKLTTKNLAQRIDLEYFKHPHPFRRLRFILSVALPLIALLWLGWYALRAQRSNLQRRQNVRFARGAHGAMQRMPCGAGRRVQRAEPAIRAAIPATTRPCITRTRYLRRIALRAMQNIADTRAWQSPRTSAARSATRTCTRRARRRISRRTSHASTAAIRNLRPCVPEALIRARSS